jgi:hypothetical protein
MSLPGSSTGSKIFKTLGFLAIIGVVFTLARLIIKGIRSADRTPDGDQDGV